MIPFLNFFEKVCMVIFSAVFVVSSLSIAVLIVSFTIKCLKEWFTKYDK